MSKAAFVLALLCSGVTALKRRVNRDTTLPASHSKKGSIDLPTVDLHRWDVDEEPLYVSSTHDELQLDFVMHEADDSEGVLKTSFEPNCEDIAREAQVLSDIQALDEEVLDVRQQHARDSVVQAFGYFHGPDSASAETRCSLLLEYVEGTTLWDLLSPLPRDIAPETVINAVKNNDRSIFEKRDLGIHPEDHRIWAWEVLQTMRLFHQAGWVHGDIHATNVIVDEDGVPHVFDFDSAARLPKEDGPRRRAMLKQEWRRFGELLLDTSIAMWEVQREKLQNDNLKSVLENHVPGESLTPEAYMQLADNAREVSETMLDGLLYSAKPSRQLLGDLIHKLKQGQLGDEQQIMDHPFWTVDFDEDLNFHVDSDLWQEEMDDL